MSTLSSDIRTRAGLDRSPDEIMEKRQQELEEEIAELKKVAKRIRNVRGVNDARGRSYSLMRFLSAMFFWALFISRPTFRFSFLLVALVSTLLAFVSFRPFSRFFLWRRGLSPLYDAEGEMRWKEGELAALSYTTTVPEYYLAGLKRVREEVLGPASKLARAEKDLQLRRRQISSDQARISARIKRAKGDEERIVRLKKAWRVLRDQYKPISLAIQQLQEVLSKTEAIISECEASVRNMGWREADEELIQKIKRDAQGDTDLLLGAEASRWETMADISRRVAELQSALQIHTSPPELIGGQDIEAWIRGVDQMQERIAELEVSSVRRLR